MTSDLSNVTINYRPGNIRYFFADIPPGARYEEGKYLIRNDLPQGSLAPGQGFTFPGTDVKSFRGDRLCMVIQDDQGRTLDICDARNATINIGGICPTSNNLPLFTAPMLKAGVDCTRPENMNRIECRIDCSLPENRNDPRCQPTPAPAPGPSPTPTPCPPCPTPAPCPEPKECGVSDVPWWLWVLLAIFFVGMVGFGAYAFSGPSKTGSPSGRE